MSEFPRMMFRKGDADDVECHGLHCQTMVVDSADEMSAAIKDGWSKTAHEAHGVTPVQPLPEPKVEQSASGPSQDEYDALLREFEQLQKDVDVIQRERVALSEQVNLLTVERDELKELMAAFDGDDNGKPGGSKPKGK